ncbi:MAG TPA: aspartate aminotransferase family protein [Polyangiaceae bacterium LLY-WYZ-15_(1-7)]|nr:aspartate aminotransferase family protein [Polyangiaceae bacterium LLY-WYZ-15_(1-7)]HJL01645.1 aspartate aminotransferase family protein [Polyangiaceae bacterium LLY-WYZ-15_(1-7)]HJL08685.1 aspartate aminotransferase family protein [Polyangiaceae bacterium LLY-WYZ-15_(1-7)]HJL33924.1 aspartate aminotransferase family protein [Polyangiaceae bacterium LLY-WYZ-15_(1-7)]HJL36995.1 aspartate aminotransferase family protein [Polyangiaceae bacterium LLY-WYZ-15_(1-7)]
MAMPQQGMSTDEVFARLDEYRQDDLPVKGGRAWGFVYDAGPEVDAVKQRAVVTYLGKNGLDPTVFPSLERLENDILAIARDHLNGGEEVVGTFTSGGTESCMLAVKAARERGRAKGIEEPELLLPVTAHAAFHKGARYFGVKVVPVAVDPESFMVDLADLEAKLGPSTVLMVGSAAGYAHGVIDPIEAMGKLAKERDVLLHVDGCIGAWLLPFLAELGEDIPPFDFRVPGVTSISMDLHKYAYAPKGSSVLLFRDAELRRHSYFACAGWTGYSVVNTTMQSTKSAAPLAGAWAVLHYLGHEGYRKLAASIRDATRALLEGIEAQEDLRILGAPKMGLIAIASDTVEVFQLCDALAARGWYVQPQLAYGGSPKNVHLMVEPANARMAEPFLADLAECVREVKASPAEGPNEMLVQAAKMLTPEMVEQRFDELIAMVGGGGGEEGGMLPKERAGLNAVIDMLSTETKEALLKEFMSKLYRA